MKQKGGYINGSIYTKDYKNGGVGYIAEIQFQGRRLRRTNPDLRVIEEWEDDVCSRVNAHLAEYNRRLSEELKRVKESLYQEMMARVNPILDEASLYDLTNKRCAEVNGLTNTDHVRTYIIRDEASGYYKIGKSKDLYRRLCITRTHAPHIQLYGYIDADVEKELHAKYTAKHIKGEWYILDEDDLKNLDAAYLVRKGGPIFI